MTDLPPILTPEQLRAARNAAPRPRRVAPPHCYAIDPGVAGAGCAVADFDAGVLVEARFLRARDVHPRAFIRALVVVERPAYQGGRSLGARVQDHMALSWEGAALAYALAANPADVVELTPAQWKGSQHKPQQHARLWEVLDGRERGALGGAPTHAAIMRAREKGALDRWSKPGGAYYPSSFVRHNLLDAAALGCVYLGRLSGV